MPRSEIRWNYNRERMFRIREKTEWRLRSRTVALGVRTQVMGILNITPDSFSDGGCFISTEKAVAHGLRLLEDGADLLDLGGESTRPGKHEPVTEQQEQDRVLPVLEALLKERPEALLSIDTYHAGTARAAVRAGAEIVNDVSGFLWDAEMAGVCSELACGVVLMHTRGTPDQWRFLPPLRNEDVFATVQDGLASCLELAATAGVDANRIVLDPGYGFGKAFEENYVLLAEQEKLRSLGRPLLIGLSRKKFLGNTLQKTIQGRGSAPMDREIATVAATTAAVLAGADIVRVHNVLLAVDAVRIADAVLEGASPF